MATVLGSLIYELVFDDKELKGGLKKSEAQIEQFAGNAKKAGLGIAAIGAGVTVFAKKATDYLVDTVKETKRLSRETGLATDESSRLLYATKRMGLSAEQTSQMFGVFAKNIKASNQESAELGIQQRELSNKIDITKAKIRDITEEIRKNGDKSGDLTRELEKQNIALEKQQKDLDTSASSMDKLGVATKNADGNARSFNDILLDTADKFKNMKNGTEETALAMELFGRSGKDLLPFLNKGADGIKDLYERADKLGLTLDSKTIGSVSRFIQSQKDVEDSSNAMKIAVGTLTAPVLTQFNNKVAEMVTSLANGNGALSQATGYALAFGGPVLTAVGSLTAFIASLVEIRPVLAAIGAPIIAITAAATGMYVAVVEAQKSTSGWGQAISALLFVIAPAVSIINAVKTAVTGETAAKNALKASNDSLKISEDNLRASKVSQEAATLAVERATLNQSEAIRQFGPTSLQAREATNQLKQAKINLADATNRAKDADRQHKDEASKNSALENQKKKLNETSGSWHGLSSAISSAVSWLRNWNNTPVSQKNVSAAATASSAARRAIGGPVQQGSPYWVGERGVKELFVPEQSGRIVPLSDIEKIVGGRNVASSQDNSMTVNIGTIEDKQDADYLIARLDRNQILSSRGGSPQWQT